MNICHFSSVHPLFDTRVFYRECKGLVQLGHHVTLVVTGVASGEHSGVEVIGVRKSTGGRVGRMVFTVWRVFMATIRIRADVFHFHDPELLPIGLLMRVLGRKVVYDVHEDYEEDLFYRPYLTAWVRKPLARCVGWFERACARCMSGIVSATDHIHRKFCGLNQNAVAIHNYPMPNELHGAPSGDDQRDMVCYVGNITEARGISQMIGAISLAGVKLELAGLFESESLRNRVTQLKGWIAVRERGQVERANLPELMARCFAGLVLLQPTPNQVVAEPLKLFEYMSAGLAVVASNFPLWRQIVDGSACGLCVNPENEHEIAMAIQSLRDNPGNAAEMGRRGRAAIENKYNWSFEVQKLERMYQSILGGNES